MAIGGERGTDWYLNVLVDGLMRARQPRLTGGALCERRPVLQDARHVRLEREAARRRRHAERELDARREQLEQHCRQTRAQRRLEQVCCCTARGCSTCERVGR